VKETRRQLTPVFWVAGALSLAFVAWGVVGSQSLGAVTKVAQDAVVADFGWLYLIATTAFLVFALYLALSRFGHIKLGKDDDEPEFSRFAWFAMLFQAGMGIGLVFWSVSEPINHFGVDPPYGLAQPGTTAAADLSLRYTFFHWALHPWAIYAVTALALAYFNFRRNSPGLISAVLRPIFGPRMDGPLGHAIDILAVLATLFGVAVSLGLGALQINSGLSFTFGLPQGAGPQILIIAVTTVVFIASAVTGLQRGIKWLSTASLVVAGVLLLFVLVTGPTLTQLNALTQVSGSYLGDLIPMSFRINAFAQDDWAGQWTLFYWATWISWAPYVGSFIARISRGRTIREFVLAVLIVPSLLSFLWFAVFGGAGIELDQATGGLISRAVAEDEAVGLFTFFDQLPLGLVTSVVAIVLVFIFFVAGADAGTIVLGRFTTGGMLTPSKVVQVAWGLVMGAFAAILLLTGGLDALQQASILAALPFVFVLLAMCVAVYRGLSEEAHEAEGASRGVARSGGVPTAGPMERQADGP
jgi:glycine betaine transporter